MRLCRGYAETEDITHLDNYWTEILALARQENALPEGMAGASRAVQGVCVRALAMSGDTLFRFFEQFEKLL